MPMPQHNFTVPEEPLQIQGPNISGCLTMINVAQWKEIQVYYPRAKLCWCSWTTLGFLTISVQLYTDMTVWISTHSGVCAYHIPLLSCSWTAISSLHVKSIPYTLCLCYMSLRNFTKHKYSSVCWEIPFFFPIESVENNLWITVILILLLIIII